MTLTDEIEAFIRDHGKHGQLTGDASTPTSGGYEVRITSPCGVTFLRWVTALAALVDLAAVARRN